MTDEEIKKRQGWARAFAVKLFQARQQVKVVCVKEQLAEALEEKPDLLESEMEWVKW